MLSSLAALFTAGPAFGGETFSESVQNALGLETDTAVWRLLCLLALLVSVGAAVLTNLGKSQDDVGRLASAEAANTELEGLSSLLQFGHLTVEDAVKLYQQYSAKSPSWTTSRCRSVRSATGTALRRLPTRRRPCPAPIRHGHRPVEWLIAIQGVVAV
ncbi:MAG TPA: hypothetical protein VK402_14340 [Blastococcus sp.]|nr:hypothetical protein [Blastococcus sp.]